MMTYRVLPYFAILLAAAASGCSLLSDGARTLVIEPLHYCNPLDKWVTRSRHQALANSAWDELLCEQPGPFSADNERGFKEGFVDYLDFGGTGEPPPIPPRRYWNDRYRTPEGRRAVEDWFAGFRFGALEAQTSGCREYATVPTSIPFPCDMGPTDSAAASGPALEPIPIPVPTPSLPPAIEPPPRDGFLPAPQGPAIPNAPNGVGFGVSPDPAPRRIVDVPAQPSPQETVIQTRASTTVETRTDQRELLQMLQIQAGFVTDGPFKR